MIRFEDALAQILEAIPLLDIETVSLLDALGRVMGEDIHASGNLPPANHSSMDGYAVRAKDTAGASAVKPAHLDILEDIPAGTVPSKSIGPGQASRIMTGAQLPTGADAVVRLEDTEKDSRSVRVFIDINGAGTNGRNLRLTGEDVRAGELVIPKGTIIRPAEIGMMAALGRAFVSVRQRPLAAVLATGDELAEIGATPVPGQIIGSNSYATAAQIVECGAVALRLGIAKDRQEDLREKFRAARRADLIISSGGVSVGDHDLVKDIMKEPGNRIQFWQVAMKPGKQMAFGFLGGIPLFALPGNPVSSIVSFEQFVRPSLLKMMGHRNLFRRTVRAALEEDVAKEEGMRYLLRGRIQRDGNRFTVSTTGAQGSGMLKSMVRANGLIVLEEQVTVARRGEEVPVQLLDGSLDQTQALF